MATFRSIRTSQGRSGFLARTPTTQTITKDMEEKFNYVIHADEIARGRPHMRNHEGSFAWLNNNPGNITGVLGGPNFGQYPGKFNWHNFLIFPMWADGNNAIAMLLRTPTYVNLSILDAFKKYAPESDGNDQSPTRTPSPRLWGFPCRQR